MTRVASGAQRSGAATLRLVSSREASLIYALPRDFFRFVCATPTHWDTDTLWAARAWLHRPGSRVPHGPGGGTAKRLILRGSVVLFHGPTRDVCGRRPAHASAWERQNHRTTEPVIGNDGNPSLSGVGAVLARFCGSAPTKIGGGYASSSPSSPSRPDQGLSGGSARRNFRRRRGAGGGRGRADRGNAELLGRACKNGGFLRFFEARSGHVGMAMSECSAGMADFYASPLGVRQPARFTGGALATCLADPRGVDPAGRGVEPPTAPRRSCCMLAQPSLGIWVDFNYRHRWVRKECSSSFDQIGSGERPRPALSANEGANAARSGVKRRIGDGGIPCSVPKRHRRASTLWTGVARVN